MPGAEGLSGGSGTRPSAIGGDGSSSTAVPFKDRKFVLDNDRVPASPMEPAAVGEDTLKGIAYEEPTFGDNLERLAALAEADSGVSQSPEAGSAVEAREA